MLDALFPAPAAARRGARRRRRRCRGDRCGARRRRGGRRRDDPDARDEGPRVVSRRAERSATRIPARPRRRCCCARSPTCRGDRRRRVGSRDRPTMATRTVLVGPPGVARASASGRLLPVVPCRTPAAAAGRRPSARPPVDRRARAPARSPSTAAAAELTALAARRSERGPARRSARSSRPRRCSPATRASSSRRWPRSTTGATAEEAIDRVDRPSRPTARRRRRRVLPRAGRRPARRRPARRRAAARAGRGRRCGTPTAPRPSSSPTTSIRRSSPRSARSSSAGIALAGGAPTGHAAIVARALGIPLVLGPRGRPARRPRRRRGRRRRRRSAGCSSSPTRRGPDRRRRRRRPATAHAPSDPTLHGIAVVVGQRRLGPRGGGRGRGRRRWDRARPDRAAVPGPLVAARPRRAARDLPPRIAAAMAGRPVVFRTLDIGGDKPARTWQADAGDEPGPRRPRRPARPARARAARDAAPGAARGAPPAATLRVMLPMVATRRGGRRRARGSIEPQPRPCAPAARRDGRPARGHDRGPVGGDHGRRVRRRRRLLLHRDQRPRPVHARRRPDQPGPGGARDAAPAGGPAARSTGSSERRRTHGRPVAVCGEAAADPIGHPAPGRARGPRAERGAGVDRPAVRAVVAGLDLGSCAWRWPDCARRLEPCAEVQALLDLKRDRPRASRRRRRSDGWRRATRDQPGSARWCGLLGARTAGCHGVPSIGSSQRSTP